MLVLMMICLRVQLGLGLPSVGLREVGDLTAFLFMAVMVMPNLFQGYQRKAKVFAILNQEKGAVPLSLVYPSLW